LLRTVPHLAVISAVSRIIIIYIPWTILLRNTPTIADLAIAASGTRISVVSNNYISPRTILSIRKTFPRFVIENAVLSAITARIALKLYTSATTLSAIP
jgi:hypothetical protein